MRTEKIGSHTVRLYDGIDELPITRFQKYCKYSLYDSGIGSDPATVEAHLRRLAVFVRKDPDKAITELQNLQMNIGMILNEVNPSNMAFACFVVEIDGKAYNDLSDEGIKKLLQRLSSEKQSVIDGVFSSIKKKIGEDMETYFPENVDNSKEVEYNIILRERALKEFDRIIEICDRRIAGDIPDTEAMDSEIEELTGRLYIWDAPPVFTGTHAADIRFDKDFETTCSYMTKYMEGKDAKSLSALEWYQTLDLMKSDAKKAKRRSKKR